MPYFINCTKEVSHLQDEVGDFFWHLGKENLASAKPSGATVALVAYASREYTTESYTF